MESRREKEEVLVDANGLSSSSHVDGIDDSISPTDGSRMPVLGSRVAAFDGRGTEVDDSAMVDVLVKSEWRNLRRSKYCDD